MVNDNERNLIGEVATLKAQVSDLLRREILAEEKISDMAKELSEVKTQLKTSTAYVLGIAGAIGFMMTIAGYGAKLLNWFIGRAS